MVSSKMVSQEEVELSNCITVSRRKNKTPQQSKEVKKIIIASKRTASSISKPKVQRQYTKKATKEPDRKILVAVDFGTTFSGVMWAQTRNPDAQNLITEWPDGLSDGLGGVSNDKVPTEIAYNGANCIWGYQIGDLEKRHQWFKLDLDPSQAPLNSDLSSRYPDPRDYLPHYTAEKLTTDFLTGLRKQTERVLVETVLESALRSTPIEYIITVPAVWSDLAQAKTRACAEEAGMGDGQALHIISEPEAAAIWALSALDPHGIKIGDTFTLCDAGGGTVDLITYTVCGLKPMLKLTEAAPGSGALCGASYLNRGFQELLVEKLGNEPGWDEEVMEEAMKRFETVVKRQFRGSVGEIFQIPVPGLQDNKELRIRKNKFTCTATEIQAIFDPVVKGVLNLVNDQINAAQRQVKAVILVGGFGQNGYLRQALREAVKSSGVEVMQSPNGWTAVARGALMKGLASTSAFATVKIRGRSARKHYGINCGIQYLDQEHGNARKIWDACSGFYRTYNMEWFIQKGNLVKEDDPVRLNYQRKRLVSRGPFTTIATIIYCSNAARSPKYVEDDSVTQLVKVEADLSRIPNNRIPKIKGADGKMYYMIDYAIRVTYLSAYTTYELIYGGVNYGHITAEYV